MRRSLRIEGYAIASIDGMIADSTGFMPDSLKIEADQRFFEDALERSDVVIHGRMSFEDQPNSPARRRLILTRRIAALDHALGNENARLWNPSGASLEEALGAVGCRAGTIAVLGGPDVYSLFLPIGYDKFFLCRAMGVSLPGGVPVFPEGRLGRVPEQVLSGAGLEVAATRPLGEDVTLVEWTPAP
jgi:dihydrofolate reductase